MSITHLGRYEIVGVLGRGAMGVVYKARDPLIERTVAIKTIACHGLSRDEVGTFEHRFFREAKSAGRLNHPNIVTIYDIGRDGDLAYIAMELLEGRSLREILDSGVVLPDGRIADIAAQVADGLAFAHANDIVHRDVKPANVMVLDNGTVKIADFGVALLPTGSVTQEGTVFGSPKYMSPEQVTGQVVDGRSDVFSLGAVLYEMLTGLPPFSGDDLGAILHKVITSSPAAPSGRRRNLHPLFDAIVAKAMAKDPAERYRSAEEMAADLRRCARPELDPATTEEKGGSAADGSAETASGTATARPRRWRNALAAGAAVIVLLAIVAARLLLQPTAPGPETSAEPHVTPPAATAAKLPEADTALPSGSATTVDAVPTVRPAKPAPRPRRAPASPASPASPPSPPSPASPARPAPPATPAPLPPRPPGPMAHLQVTVSPWGEVYVDGRYKGISPPMGEIELTSGPHVIEVRNTSFPPYRQRVVLTAEESTRIEHKFQSSFMLPTQ